jgi:DNA-binding beta-propeller fold protein YncE
MRKGLLLLSLLLSLVAFSGAGRADDKSAQRFATLPDGVRFPEGITANPATRDIFVATFDFGPNANKLLRFSNNGQLTAQRDFGATPLLGLEFRSGNVYIANFGAGQIQRMPANFSAGTAIQVVADIPKIGAPIARHEGNPDGSQDLITFGSNSVPAPNGLVFDKAGNLYVSDSFQGAIFRVNNATTCAPCSVTTISHDPLLATTGFPSFGANGLALSSDENTLFVANTGDDRVLVVNVSTGIATVFAESINGADGLVFDDQRRLWVAANQNDEIVALNAKARVTARVGEFNGINRDGTPEGLLFPASMVILGDDMFVTNVALPLTPVVGDEPEEDVTRWTISRIKLPKPDK